jgi:hypothetical protein
MKEFSLIFVLGLLMLNQGASADSTDFRQGFDYSNRKNLVGTNSPMPNQMYGGRRLDGEEADSTAVDPIEALSSPVDFATLDEINSDPSESAVAGIIALETNSEFERNRNFIKIASDLKSYEDAYKACMSSISDSDFSQETIDKCLGTEFQFVYDDIDYEKRKIQARADTALRTAMIRLCYNEAGADLVMDNACDLIERDALDLLWDELNFYELIDYHREKYIFVHARLPEELFGKVMIRFKEIYEELEQLIEELYAHKDVTISRLKRDIDDRTAVISEKFQKQAAHPTPKIKKDIITIDEILIDHPNYHLDLDNMPRPMIENGEDQMYAMSNNPWVESFAHNIGPVRYGSINTKYETPEFDNPLRVLNNPTANIIQSNYTQRKTALNHNSQFTPARRTKTIQAGANTNNRNPSQFAKTVTRATINNQRNS